MSESDVQSKITGIIGSKDVVLFMKGSKSFPQCGFSATVVQILSGIVDDFETVNVLSDPSIRQGIKDFSNWPTIPQLYVKGEFVGGCDIIRAMYESGDLHRTLGVEVKNVTAPSITVTDKAAAILKDALADSDTNDVVHLSIDPKFRADLQIAPANAMSLKIDAPVAIEIDRGSAPRAEGLTIDYVEKMGRSGFKIDNPNAPAEVTQLSAQELKEKLDSGEIDHVYDVRTPQERDTASIKGSVLLDDKAFEGIQELDLNTPIAFYCHHGSRSQVAAEKLRDLGYRKLFNLAGGIDAWSTIVDSSVPRY